MNSSCNLHSERTLHTIRRSIVESLMLRNCNATTPELWYPTTMNP